MKKNRPTRWHFILFLILSVVALAQLSWWVIFQVGEGNRISTHQNDIWIQQMATAEQRLDETGDSDIVSKQWLQNTFPDLELSLDGELTVTSEAKKRLDTVARKRVRMFVSEGAFFSLLIFAGIWFLYWTIKKKTDLENQTAGILTMASAVMKDPAELLQRDIELLEQSGISEPERTRLIAGIKTHIFKISHACNHVSVIQSLAAGKRKISINLTDLSKKTASILSEFDNPFEQLELSVEIDIEENVKAVTNPERWSLIARSYLLMAARIVADDKGINIALRNTDGYARLNVSCEIMAKSDEIINAQIEPEFENLRAMAELIGGKGMLSKADDSNMITFVLDLPLFIEENI
ncbi:MAG: hypothetical protein V3W18_06695 [candidate division Zixibacteria bacterium]